MNLNTISAQEKKEIAISSLTQNEINSFKYGNMPNEETRLKSALIDAFEIAKIYNDHIWDREQLLEKMLERVSTFETLEELEKANEKLLIR